MATTTVPEAEQRLIDVLAQAGVPAADELTTNGGQLRATWRDPRVVVQIAVDPGLPR